MPLLHCRWGRGRASGGTNAEGTSGADAHGPCDPLAESGPNKPLHLSARVIQQWTWAFYAGWPTPTCRNLCAQHAVLEGKKAEETPPRKSTARTL